MPTELSFWIWCSHLGATFYMTGVIWFVQLVHYPLMNRIDPELFPAFEAAHTDRTFWVVAPAMLLELFTGIILFWIHPMAISTNWLWVGLILLLINAGSTAWLQIPCHEKLSQQWHAQVHNQLVKSNWIRTVCWSLRCVWGFCLSLQLLG